MLFERVVLRALAVALGSYPISLATLRTYSAVSSPMSVQPLSALLTVAADTPHLFDISFIVTIYSDTPRKRFKPLQPANEVNYGLFLLFFIFNSLNRFRAFIIQHHFLISQQGFIIKKYHFFGNINMHNDFGLWFTLIYIILFDIYAFVLVSD